MRLTTKQNDDLAVLSNALIKAAEPKKWSE